MLTLYFFNILFGTLGPDSPPRPCKRHGGTATAGFFVKFCMKSKNLTMEKPVHTSYTYKNMK